MHKIIDFKTIAFALLVVCIWAAIVVISGTGTNLFPYKWDFENTGQFGDSFGSLSAIMAALAALAALSTLRATQNEISRITLKDDADKREQQLANKRQAKRNSIEDKRLQKAEFERTLFQLLQFFNQIVSDTDIVNQNKQHPQKGKDAYKAIMDSFFRIISISQVNDQIAYQRLLDKYPNDLNHYFRFLYHIILFIDTSRISNKYFYVRLVRAMLSESELALLSLNCAYGEGLDKFQRLVYEYALLHNLSDEMRQRLNLNDLYNSRAFELTSVAQ